MVSYRYRHRRRKRTTGDNRERRAWNHLIVAPHRCRCLLAIALGAAVMIPWMGPALALPLSPVVVANDPALDPMSSDYGVSGIDESAVTKHGTGSCHVLADVLPMAALGFRKARGMEEAEGGLMTGSLHFTQDNTKQMRGRKEGDKADEYTSGQQVTAALAGLEQVGLFIEKVKGKDGGSGTAADTLSLPLVLHFVGGSTADAQKKRSVMARY